jgi:hypothetical protein
MTVCVMNKVWAADFNREIRPILSNKCFACHGPDEGKRQAGLWLDDSKIARGELEPGAIAIVPGKPESSELVRRITSPDVDERMPPADIGKPLSAVEVDLLRKWIEQGARFATHWSYVKPVRTQPPDAVEAWRDWPRNAIDLFALQAMLAHGLHPSPEADRYSLARRVFLDLTGLPPTIEEADAFAKSEDPRAHEKLVDDLLRRPSYGEHWDRMWVDLAVHVHDLQATILQLLGYDHKRLTFRFQGRDYRLTDVHGSVVPEILA